MNTQILTPRRPHILRAFYDWLLENALTPHLVVDATLPMVEVPRDYVKDGQIVLNVSPQAVADLVIDNQQIAFNARFGGQSMYVVVPMYAAIAIYARENGAGTMFEPEPGYDKELEDIAEKTAAPLASIGLVEQSTELLTDEVDDSVSEEEPAPKKTPKDKKSKKGPPNLTVVK